MKSLAIFVHYSRDGKVCKNAILYAKELCKHFDDVIISSNIIINTADPNIICLCFEKNGYDFGYFYQALELINAYETYTTIGFFNDSNYIINSLDIVLKWCLSNNLDFCGITDSYGGRPEIKDHNQYHIQSHFLIFKGIAIGLLKDYMIKYKFEDYVYNIPDAFTKRLNVIIYYEIMLSIFMRIHNIKMGAYYSANKFIKKVSTFPPQINIHMLLWKELIDDGYPLIKRKLVNKNFTDQDFKELMNTKGMTSMTLSKEVLKKQGNINFTKTI
jgi:lipopolysaccharide biosynthesis protein